MSQVEEKYSGNTQECVTDFGTFFLQLLAEETSLPINEKELICATRKQFLSINTSPIIPQFLTSSINTVTCNNCDFKSSSCGSHISLDLSLPPTRETTLEECIKFFTSDELFEDCLCYKCRTKGKKSRTQLTHLAPTCVINLKRAQFDSKSNATIKNMTPVTFPLVLSISDFEGKKFSYELQSIVVHFSNNPRINNGHFVSYVKNNGSWFFASDENVNVVEIEEVLKQKSNVHVLFYQKIESSNNSSNSNVSPIIDLFPSNAETYQVSTVTNSVVLLPTAASVTSPLSGVRLFKRKN